MRMENIDPKVQRIIDWREDFVTMSDNHFFEIIHMYLGEIHSPFNKQKLMRELDAFLHREETQRAIVNLLSETDILLLSAIKFIPDATQEKLAVFFTGTFNFAEIYERLLNLEERLLIYRKKNRNGARNSPLCFMITPVLEEALSPYLKMEVLFPQKNSVAERIENRKFHITPEVIASFCSFLNKTPDLFKADGDFKKKTAEILEQIFPQADIKFFHVLANAFSELHLFNYKEGKRFLDSEKLKKFAELDEVVQYVYIAASINPFGRRRIVMKQAQILLNTINSLPEEGCTFEEILRREFFVTEKLLTPELERSRTPGRFSEILARAQNEENDRENDFYTFRREILENAVTIGLLELCGKTSDGTELYCAGPAFIKENRFEYGEENFPKVLNIDSTFSATVFPGLPLKKLLPLMNFLEIRQFDTAPVFEITKKSVMHAFDAGMKFEDITSLINEFSAYGIPQNVTVSIEDWNKLYNSAMIFKGYILKVDEENRPRVEKNPSFSPYIKEILAPGVFLIDAKDDKDAERIISLTGMDYIGKIHTSDDEEFSLSKDAENVFAGRDSIQPAEKMFIHMDFPDSHENTSVRIESISEEERALHFEKMRTALEKIPMTKEERESLLFRINRKIILVPSQLTAASVKHEQIEANGMDFQGKIHVAESAIAQEMMLELTYSADTPGGEDTKVIGIPVSIEKNPLDANVLLCVEPENSYRKYSIGRAKNVRRLRNYLAY